MANVVDMGLSSNQNKYHLNKKPCYIRWSVSSQILLYVCEILPTTKGDKEKIRVLKRRILLRKYVTKKIISNNKNRVNMELRQLYNELKGVLLFRRAVYTRQVTCGDSID